MTPPGRTQREADPVDPDVEEAADLDDESEGEPEVEPEVDADHLDEGDDLEADEVPTGDPTLETDDVADDEEPPTSAVVPPEAEFDDGGEDLVTAVTGEDDDDDHDPIEGVRDGEFVCRSCFMAKRDTQLADTERLLCRDCA